MRPEALQEESMGSGFRETPDRKRRFWDRLLPLRHWLGADVSGGTELGQAKTRLICTFVGLCGFGRSEPSAASPPGFVATAVVFPVYALAYLLWGALAPAPTHGRRGFAVVMDNVANVYITYFGGPFAAYAGFLFLVNDWLGAALGRPLPVPRDCDRDSGMACNLVLSPYWENNLLFGGTIILGLLA